MSKTRLSLYAAVGVVVSGVLLRANTSQGGWFCNPFSDRCRATSQETADGNHHGCRCFGFEPAPDAAVVSAIPAVMVAQPAVAVTPQQVEEALRGDEEESQRERLTMLLLEALTARLGTSPEVDSSGTATAAPESPGETELDRLEHELDQLRQAIDLLTPLLQESSR